jgi:hypothetical protein
MMFTAEQVQARLRERPFRPLRILADEGLRFDVYQVFRVALVHVVAIQDLPGTSSPTTNGPSA